MNMILRKDKVKMTKAKSELIAQDLASKIKHQQFKEGRAFA